jgi:hypothetical protein
MLKKVASKNIYKIKQKIVVTTCCFMLRCKIYSLRWSQKGCTSKVVHEKALDLQKHIFITSCLSRIGKDLVIPTAIHVQAIFVCPALKLFTSGVEFTLIGLIWLLTAIIFTQTENLSNYFGIILCNSGLFFRALRINIDMGCW